MELKGGDARGKPGKGGAGEGLLLYPEKVKGAKPRPGHPVLGVVALLKPLEAPDEGEPRGEGQRGEVVQGGGPVPQAEHLRQGPLQKPQGALRPVVEEDDGPGAQVEEKPFGELLGGRFSQSLLSRSQRTTRFPKSRAKRRVKGVWRP